MPGVTKTPTKMQMLDTTKQDSGASKKRKQSSEGEPAIKKVKAVVNDEDAGVFDVATPVKSKTTAAAAATTETVPVIDAIVDTTPEGIRRHHLIRVYGENCPDPVANFSTAGFSKVVTQQLKMAGFASPTAIQSQGWPVVKTGRDCIAVAKTGSGKTIAYLLPAMQHIQEHPHNAAVGPTVLILAPTRELAIQIEVEAKKFPQAGLRTACVYGGVPKGPQIRAVRSGAQIVIATPGRMNDLLTMGVTSLSNVSFLVLDEADRMLDMGFEPQIRQLVEQIPVEHQTVFFTATWPKAVQRIANDFLKKDKITIDVNNSATGELVANTSVEQEIRLVEERDKLEKLEEVLKAYPTDARIIVFAGTKRACDELERELYSKNWQAYALHGDKEQHQRDFVMQEFRSGKAPILVATDVAARGLDIKGVKVVVNYAFPNDVEDYIHRIGRTGRAGETGKAITFFTNEDKKHASALVQVLKRAKQPIPTELLQWSQQRQGGARSFSRYGGGGGGGRFSSGGGGKGRGYGNGYGNGGRGGQRGKY